MIEEMKNDSLLRVEKAELKIGDRVKVIPAAKTYITGETIPNYMKYSINTIEEKEEGKSLLKNTQYWIDDLNLIKE